MSPIFPIDFVSSCSSGVSVSWKIGKVEKEKALKLPKQESNKKVSVGKFTEIITHTALAHSEASQTVRWSLLSLLKTWMSTCASS